MAADKRRGGKRRAGCGFPTWRRLEAMTSDAIAALRERLSAAGYKVQQASIADRDALVARRADFRLEWMATRDHTFVVAFVVDALEEALAAALSSAARQYAIDHKGGLPRGLQTGTATIAVFITNECEQTTRSWFGHEPERRFAALLAPVLVEVGTRQVTYFSRLKYGSVYSDYLHALVENVIAPGYRFSAGLDRVRPMGARSPGRQRESRIERLGRILGTLDCLNTSA